MPVNKKAIRQLLLDELSVFMPPESIILSINGASNNDPAPSYCNPGVQVYHVTVLHNTEDKSGIIFLYSAISVLLLKFLNLRLVVRRLTIVDNYLDMWIEVV